MKPSARSRGWPLIALAVLLAALSARVLGLFTPFEHRAADLRARALKHEVASDIVIVGIDSPSLADLQQWPWPRRYHARLLERLADAQPGRVFIDIDFSARTTIEDDALLAAALSRFERSKLFLPAFLQHATGGQGELIYTRPLPEFASKASLAGINFTQDADSLVRSAAASWDFEGQRVPSAVAAIAGSASTEIAEIAIDFSISPTSFTFISYVDLLAGRVAPADLHGKTIVVGATATELNDMLPTPVYRLLPGVVIQALAAQSLLSGAPHAPPVWLSIALLAGLTMLAAMLFCRCGWRTNLAALAGMLAALILIDLYAYAEHRLMLEVAPAVAALLLCLSIATIRSLDQQTLRALAYALGLRRRDALLGSIIESSTDCIVCIGRSGRIEMANAAGARLFHCTMADLMHAPLARFVPIFSSFDHAAISFRALCDKVTEQNALRPDGDEFPVEISVSPVQFDEEALYTVIVRDISERKAQEHRLQYQATHDPLTTLPNRAALTTLLGQLVADARENDTIALLMLDLCRFKEVNDTLGHAIGDEVLREVARRFESVESAALVARIGGDEFTMVLQASPDQDALTAVCQRLSDCLRTPIEAGGISIEVGVSIGVARFPADAADVAALLKRADVAMYESKRRGSVCEFYDAACDQNSVRRLTMVSELRNAIGAAQLTLNYQPQVNLQTDRAESVEALLRWRHPVHGMVSPAEFITIAESTDLIRPLTDWTLRQALMQAIEWRDAGFTPRIAVNLSARVLQDVDFPARLRAVLASYVIAPDRLELEITESAMMQDPARALRVIQEIHELGVFMSIDDFGTGFSSLGYLRDLPVHALKLDKSFVLHLDERAQDRSIVKSTVGMAHELGLQVVAEGVETQWAARYLAEAGYDYAQGYFYSAAKPAPQCLEWMLAFNASREAHGAFDAQKRAFA